MTDGQKKIAVIAIGGNSLIADDKHVTVEDQYQAARETIFRGGAMLDNGWLVAV